MHWPNEFLANLAGALNVEFLDLLPAFQREAAGKPFFEYDEHLSSFGHRVVSEALAERLETLVGPTSVRQLSQDGTPDRYPALSQDGSMMTYQSFRDGNMELFIATADMQRSRQLTFNDVDESHATLSKDGEQILFTQGAPESHRTNVVLMRLDGSDRKVLTPGPELFGAIPSFSRSNLHIAYAEWQVGEVPGTLTLPRIAVLDVSSGVKRYITPPSRESWRPVFSPDETKVYYISKVSQQFDLYSFDLLTGMEVQLTNTPFDEWDPQVAPDGSKLVYAAHADGNWDLFVLKVATKESHRLTRTKGDEWDPGFSPDGSSIVFAGRFGLVEAIFQMAYEGQ